MIGCDTSSASGKDACTIVIRSIKTGKVVGVGRYSRAYLDDVGTILVDLLETIPNSMLVIERNYAHQMIDNLLTILLQKEWTLLKGYSIQFIKTQSSTKRVPGVTTC